MKFDKSYLILPVLLNLVFNVSCSKTIQPKQELNLVEHKLHEATEVISKDLALLTGNSSRINDTTNVTDGLGELMDLNFSGPIAEALTKVSAKSGYQLKIEGKEPINPPLIHVNLKHRPCLAILRAIGQQTPKNVGVLVAEQTQTITLKYEQNSQ